MKKGRRIDMVKKKSHDQGSSSKKADRFFDNQNNNVHKQVIPIYVIFSLIILLSIYLLSPLSNLDTLSVEGNNEVVDQEIIDASGLQSGVPIWETYFDRQTFEESIVNNLPQVADAQLNFSGVDDFTIDIDEYNTIAYLNTNETYYKVLENGETLQDDSGSVGENPVLINFNDEDTLKQMVEQLDQLDSSTIQLISEIEKVDIERNPLLVRTYMNDGSQVLASIPTYAERITLYPRLQEAVDGQKGLFDLEAGAYFTPFSDPNETGVDNENIVEDRIEDNGTEEPPSSTDNQNNQQNLTPENSAENTNPNE